tara:strand:- start:471 stop:587 length:117 start_codon:yes stop_codon:yes gene_type:complete
MGLDEPVTKIHEAGLSDGITQRILGGNAAALLETKSRV